ncbi:WXG100 family type VII secretion target [Gordonia sp. DT30]|uniref:WXG100 family type VII secretion target n=1 Tax=unclassified Gordonia (in: high G+C Gram-positive bacteria) TaxID=2657482 RepID=UPI003CFB1C2F
MNLDGAVDVDIASGQATAQSVSQIVDDMQAVIRQIASAASTGVSSWNGRASNAFDNTHSDWNSSARALNTALDDIRNQLTAGFGGYEDNDSQAAGGFGGAGPLRL